MRISADSLSRSTSMLLSHQYSCSTLFPHTLKKNKQKATRLLLIFNSILYIVYEGTRDTRSQEPIVLMVGIMGYSITLLFFLLFTKDSLKFFVKFFLVCFSLPVAFTHSLPRILIFLKTNLLSLSPLNHSFSHTAINI